MQIIEFSPGTLRFLDDVPARVQPHGFLWICLERPRLAAQLPRLQQAAMQIGHSALLDLHVKDLDNALHPSRYDFTSIYDVVIFRRLATGGEAGTNPEVAATPPAKPGAHTLESFRRIRTEAMGFVVFDRLLITVHPAGCPVVRAFTERYVQDAGQADASPNGARSRLPTGPADLMLRMVNAMVDGFLELRRQLTTELTEWQERLLRPGQERADWGALMVARTRIHQLEDMCEEQSDAMQEWLDTAREQPPPMLTQAERDALVARANDVIEHIQRVITQVRRMEQGAEAVVQIHFSAQSHRTNAGMRTLTALTAIFLPLNLITGIFGMNFASMPMLQDAWGFWIAIATMIAVAGTLGLLFWRMRYLARTGR